MRWADGRTRMFAHIGRRLGSAALRRRTSGAFLLKVSGLRLFACRGSRVDRPCLVASRSARLSRCSHPVSLRLNGGDRLPWMGGNNASTFEFGRMNCSGNSRVPLVVVECQPWIFGRRLHVLELL